MPFVGRIITKANMADAYHTEIPITKLTLWLMDTFLNVGNRSQSSGIGLDFDELGINEVVDLLDNTNMEAVLRDFGERNQKEDPVCISSRASFENMIAKLGKDGVFFIHRSQLSLS